MEFRKRSEKVDWRIFKKGDIRDRVGVDKQDNVEYKNIRAEFARSDNFKNRRHKMIRS